MPVETAADRAALFSLEEFGEPARYTPPGGMAAACTIIVNRGQARAEFDLGERKAATSQRSVLALVDELPAVVRDGLFEMLDDASAPTGEAFKVQGLPTLDETAAIWSADVIEASV